MRDPQPFGERVLERFDERPLRTGERSALDRAPKIFEFFDAERPTRGVLIGGKT